MPQVKTHKYKSTIQVQRQQHTNTNTQAHVWKNRRPTLDCMAVSTLTSSSIVDWLNSSANSSGWKPKCCKPLKIQNNVREKAQVVDTYLHGILIVPLRCHACTLACLQARLSEKKTLGSCCIWKQCLCICMARAVERGTLFEMEWQTAHELKTTTRPLHPIEWRSWSYGAWGCKSIALCVKQWK